MQHCTETIHFTYQYRTLADHTVLAVAELEPITLMSSQTLTFVKDDKCTELATMS